MYSNSLKKLLKEILRMYKDNPVLWNKSHPQYMMLEVRNKAFGLLLEKYRTLVKDASLKEFKKCLENMRSNFTREYRKILESQQKGEEPCYKPSLWYFSDLMFLEDKYFKERRIRRVSLDQPTDSEGEGESNEEASESGLKKPDKMSPLESEVMGEVLRMFKERPVLWNKMHPQYKRREVQERTFASLLERYRRVKRDMSEQRLRKKIEGMRANTRREYRKMLQSKARGAACHTPSLWYYDTLLYIENKVFFRKPTYSGGEGHVEDSTHQLTISSPKTEPEHQLETDEECIDENRDFTGLEDDKDDDNDDDDDEDDKEDEDKLVIITPKKRKLSTVYIDEGNMTPSTENDQASSSSEEAKSFGRTVGLQLEPLDSFQRTVAEKLISEVIFYARLNKLSAHSQLKLNPEKYN